MNSPNRFINKKVMDLKPYHRISNLKELICLGFNETHMDKIPRMLMKCVTAQKISIPFQTYLWSRMWAYDYILYSVENAGFYSFTCPKCLTLPTESIIVAASARRALCLGFNETLLDKTPRILMKCVAAQKLRVCYIPKNPGKAEQRHKNSLGLQT